MRENKAFVVSGWCAFCSERINLNIISFCYNNHMTDQVTVSNIFRRALEMRKASPNGSIKDLKSQIVNEFKGGAFPEPALLTIPEYDNITPEEDWTAGLPIVLRGIQNDDWNEIAHGIAISLEQVENYPKES